MVSSGYLGDVRGIVLLSFLTVYLLDICQIVPFLMTSTSRGLNNFMFLYFFLQTLTDAI